MQAAAMLTVKKLQMLPPNMWASDGGARGAGALWFRKSDDGKRVSVYFGYAHGGKNHKLPMAIYDERGLRGLTLAQCREKYGKISLVYQSGVTDLRAHFEHERDMADRNLRADSEAAQRAAEEAQRGSLRLMLAARVAEVLPSYAQPCEQPIN
jgi:hypothetical protein